MEKDSNQIEMADIALEIGANVVISYHNATFTLPNKLLQAMKDFGISTDPMNCVSAGLLMSGKTEEELKAFLQEAHEANSELSISFEAPEGSALNIKSKEENPMLDKLVQAVENQDQE